MNDTPIFTPSIDLQNALRKLADKHREDYMKALEPFAKEFVPYMLVWKNMGKTEDEIDILLASILAKYGR